jgi:hypothetical protein
MTAQIISLEDHIKKLPTKETIIHLYASWACFNIADVNRMLKLNNYFPITEMEWRIRRDKYKFLLEIP